MEYKEIYGRIKEIVFDIPDGLYKYKKPSNLWEEEWINASPNEKGFILIRQIVEEKEFGKKPQLDQSNNNIKVLNLGRGPLFWTQADENMFFNAIYSLASFVEIKGHGTELDLYYKEPMTIHEKKFLIGLLKRYQMAIPKALEGIEI